MPHSSPGSRPEITDSYKDDLCSVLVRADNIVENHLCPAFYTGERVLGVIEKIRKTGNRPKLLVLALSHHRSMISYTGLQAVFSQEAISYSMAKAYVLRSYTQSVIAHVSRFVFKPKTPIRFFKTQQKAETWLSTFQGYGI